MNATSLIERLVSFEQHSNRASETEARAFVIDAQDCILRMQEEILQLRQMNLRLRETIEGIHLGAYGDLMPLPGVVPSTGVAA